MNGAPALVIDGLRFGYEPGKDLFGGLSLSVPMGSVQAIVGPSGFGKTTLLRLIAGLERPDGGRIEINGDEVATQRVFVPAQRRRVGVVFQDFALFPTMSAAANVAFALRHKPRKARRESAMHWLERVGVLELANAMPHTLSGGQQQRVALARALAQEPSLMLLDEPFSNLDTTARAAIRDETMDVLRRRGTTTLLVTHDPYDAECADHAHDFHSPVSGTP